MKHVKHRLEAWLGGELTLPDVGEIQAHLSTCDSCREAADQLQATWTILAEAAPPQAVSSVWPAVQARTVDVSRDNWFFGGTPAWRVGLAAMALTVGLLAGFLVPGGNRAVADEVSGVAPWLGGATWSDAGDESLDDLWLSEATDREEES